jgi:hypothetical protein
LAGKFSEPAEMFRVPTKFASIAAPEFLPASGIVTEPLSQFSAGRDILQPFIDRSGFLRHASRPKTIDQYSRAVILSGRLICAL